MQPSTPRLDNLAAMQNRPLGTNTALYRDPSTLAVGRQYKQQKSDYDMARRLLRRQARRGNTDAAMGLIGLGKDAAANNVEFGMQNVEQRDAAIAGRTAGMQREVTDMENASAMNRGMASGLAAGRTPTPTAATTPPSMREETPHEVRPIPAEGMPTRSPDGVSYVPQSVYDEKFASKQKSRATTPAKSIWDAPAQTQLGGRVYEELGRRGGADVGFRQGLDRAIGMAKTDAERGELGLAAKEAGISDEAFKRRTDWWNKKR